METINPYIKILLIALLFASIIFFTLSLFFPFQGLFINLTTEMIGILITVVFVNWILDKREESKWEKVDIRVHDRLIILLNKLMGGIRTSMLIRYDVLNIDNIDPEDSVSLHKEIMRVSKEVIIPQLYQKIYEFEKSNWSYLANHFKEVQTRITSILNNFQYRLSPQQISLLLDIQDNLSNSLSFYETFPDILGVSDENLPEPIKQARSAKHDGVKSTADYIESIITLTNKISLSILDDS